MQQLVSITSQGQVNIPKSLLKEFGITESVKAVVSKKGDSIMVKPRRNFASLKGSLASSVSLTGVELKKARMAFSKKWQRK